MHDQITYIAEAWGYIREQKKMDRFHRDTGCGEICNRFTASLLPQMILLIDNAMPGIARGGNGMFHGV